MAKVTFRDYQIGLTAGQEYYLPVSGDYYQVISATGAVKLTFDDNMSVTRYQDTGGPATYDNHVTLLSATTQVVVVSFGFCNGMAPYDGRATLAGVTVNSVVTPADTITSGVAVPCGAGVRTPLCAARSDRKTVIVSTLSDVAGYVIMGDVACDATHGTPLEPGQPVTLDTTAAVYIWNPQISAVTVWVTELRDLP